MSLPLTFYFFYVKIRPTYATCRIPEVRRGRHCQQHGYGQEEVLEMKFLNPALMFVLIAGVSVAAVGCTEDSTDDDATIDNTTIVARDNQTRTGASCSTDTVAFLKKGIISCDGDSVNPQCKECGNGGTHDCCLERLGPDWVCDYVCTNWIYPDPRDHTKKYCK